MACFISANRNSNYIHCSKQLYILNTLCPVRRSGKLWGGDTKESKNRRKCKVEFISEGVRKCIILLSGSQASPACPDKGRDVRICSGLSRGLGILVFWINGELNNFERWFRGFYSKGVKFWWTRIRRRASEARNTSELGNHLNHLLEYKCSYK
jgi:hypothetical protein